MCGIAGIWNATATEPEARLSAMLHAMQHRGPDGAGTLAFEGGAAGMVRLALVDLSDRGQQPFWSADRRVALIFNGEMYNFREERSRLSQSGHTFHSTTDTEVVLRLYLERGLDFVHRLRGMYGLAIFDWRNTAPGKLPELILVRGPLGVKPLYVAHPRGDHRQIIFASELRGLLASNLVPRTVDREALADYLARGFVLQPRTIIEGVRTVEPGWIERYAPDQPLRREQFWRMPTYQPQRETLDEAAERLRSTLDESVALHAMADAPVGAFLSGGIDSTGIVGLMRRHVADLRTYTLRYPDVPGHDEADEAAAAARTFECNHTMVEVTGKEVRDLLPLFASQIDQPSADGLNTWIISKAAARDVKGVLSGVGGDEWFAGYPVVRRMAQNHNTLRGRIETAAGHFANALSNCVPPSKFRRRLDNLAMRRSPINMWIQSHTVFRYPTARRMAGLPPRRPGDEARFIQLLREMSPDFDHETPVGLACLLDTRVYLISQLLRDSDATSMAHSLELRVPLVDLEVVKFSRSCFDHYKLDPSGGSTGQYQDSGSKRVLIHALRDLLPPGISRRPKRGFALPYETWIGGDLASLVEDTCSPTTVRRRGLVDPRLAEATWAAVRTGVGGARYPKLWSLMILELWCRAVLDEQAPVGSTQASPAIA